MRWNEIIGGYPCFRKAVPVSAAGRIRVTHPCAGRHRRHCCLHAAPRLACVKPVASVHPEPGSNSSLYKFFCLFPQPDFRFSLFKFHLFNLHWRFVSKSTRKDSLIVSPLLYYFCLFFPVFQWTLSVCPRFFAESDAKIIQRTNTLQMFRQKKLFFFQKGCFITKNWHFKTKRLGS